MTLSSVSLRLLSQSVFSVDRSAFSVALFSLSLRHPLIRSVIGFASTSSPKLLFRQLLEKESYTFTYLFADVSHPEYCCCVGVAECFIHYGTHSLSETDSTSSKQENPLRTLTSGLALTGVFCFVYELRTKRNTKLRQKSSEIQSALKESNGIQMVSSGTPNETFFLYSNSTNFVCPNKKHSTSVTISRFASCARRANKLIEAQYLCVRAHKERD
ncbi:hypothetical protein YC2023_102084 [Brassica napus]